MEDTYLEQQPIPGYRLEVRLGSGGQASVYKAIQLSMNRPVAIKIIRPGADGSSVELGRFLREAQVLARMRHDNIVQAIDYGEVGGTRYFVMEFLEGEPVAEIQKRSVFLPVAQSLDIASQVCRALDHAFKFNVIHRDIKPANIVLVNEQRAVLVDFGLARPEQSDMQVTMAGMTVGTPHYMAPEQIRGDANLDTRVDIYALGGTLFHMVTGCPPFPHQQKTQILIAHLKDPVLLPEKVPQEIPQEVFAIVKKSMRKEREKRYQKPSEMLQDLEAAMDKVGGGRRGGGTLAKVLAPVVEARPVTAGASNDLLRDLTAERDRLLREKQELVAKAEDIQKKARELLQQKAREAEDLARRNTDLERRLREAEAAASSARQRTGDLESRLTRTLAERDDLAARLAAAGAGASPGDVLEVVGVPAGDELGFEDEVTEAEPLRGGRKEESEAEFVTIEDDVAAPEPEIIVEDPNAIDEHALISLEIGDPTPARRREPPMVQIPRGRFIYGEAGSRDADPRQEMELPAFSIDVYPVTNRDYAYFVKATGRNPPDHWKGPQPPEEIADHPVVWVTWQDATDYATWARKRLPTRAEWQKAARGSDGRAFPWGNQPEVSRCNCKESGPGTTTAVGRYEKGASPFGLHDAAGNVAEWVAGEIHMPGADPRQKVRAVCSGSWRDPLERSRCASRRGYPDGGKAPYVGFRCARD